MPRAYSRKKKRKYTVGSNLTIKESKRITGTKVYGSLQEAIENGSTRFKNSQGSFVITFPKVKGDLRKIQVTSAQAAGLKQIKATNSRPTRRRASNLAGNVPKSLEGKKVERIAAKGQQFHHMMDLDSYKDFFEGLNPAQKEQLSQKLGKKGFFPGDDRRNYVGLVGNKVMIRGQNNIILGSEHQGDIHRRLNKLRKEFPLPSPEELNRMSVEQRYEAMMPHLTRDRTQLQEVIRTRRRPNSKIGVPRTANNISDVQIKPSTSRGTPKRLGTAAKLLAIPAVVSALSAGDVEAAAMNAIEAFTPVGDLMGGNISGRSFAEEQRLIEEAKFRKEVEPQMGASKNIQRETARQRQERLRRERRAQEANPLAEVGTQAMQWLQERFR